eukprot:692418-Rhodomonas_salina.1
MSCDSECECSWYYYYVTHQPERLARRIWQFCGTSPEGHPMYFCLFSSVEYSLPPCDCQQPGIQPVEDARGSSNLSAYRLEKRHRQL